MDSADQGQRAIRFFFIGGKGGDFLDPRLWGEEASCLSRQEAGVPRRFPAASPPRKIP
jgi:hypothetical protein